MPLEVSEEQELNDIVIALTRLHLCRERFNSEIELREQGLYRRLSAIRSLGLENISYEPLRRHPLSSTSSESGQQSELDRIIADANTPDRLRQAAIPTALVFAPISSPRGVRIGDRVRITSRLTHVTEDDRLATVVKVNRIKITIRTDSGHTTSRIRSNLEVLLEPQEESEEGVKHTHLLQPAPPPLLRLPNGTIVAETRRRRINITTKVQSSKERP